MATTNSWAPAAYCFKTYSTPREFLPRSRRYTGSVTNVSERMPSDRIQISSKGNTFCSPNYMPFTNEFSFIYDFFPYSKCRIVDTGEWKSFSKPNLLQKQRRGNGRVDRCLSTNTASTSSTIFSLICECLWELVGFSLICNWVNFLHLVTDKMRKTYLSVWFRF